MSPETAQRKRAMDLLAQAEDETLAGLWEDWPEKPAFDWLRRPESGLVMVRGRMGGTGAAFNLGEMTMTRCALRLETGAVGLAYVQGRSTRKAEIAALVDAIGQDPDARTRVDTSILAPLAAKAAAARETVAAETAATKVDFYTMVRGEDE